MNFVNNIFGKTNFKKNLAISTVGYKIALQYKFHTFISLLTVPLNLTIFYFLWNSIFLNAGQEVINGFTFNEMISYYVLSMIVGYFTWSEPEGWMERDIRQGRLTRYLLKPLSYLSQTIYIHFGLISNSFIIEVIPVLLIGFIFFDLKVAALSNFVFFLISLLFAFVLVYFLGFLLGMSAFWLKKITGISGVKRASLYLLTGGMIPLTFFPETVQRIFHFLPFEYIRFVPINIYLGKYSTVGNIAQLSLQLFWILFLYLLIKILWNKAAEKFAGSGT